VNAQIRDVWFVTQAIKVTYGFNLAVMQFAYHIFLYDHFGGDPKALNLTVSLLVITSFGILISEVPTGVIGDYIGRKKTVIASFVVAGAAFFLRTWIYFVPSLTYSYVLALLAAIFYAISFTLFSGSFSAWLVDTVRDRNIKEGHGPIIAKSYGRMIVAKVFGAVVGVGLYLIGYVVYAYAFCTILSLLCAFYCGISMKETESLSFFKGKIFVQESISKMKAILINGFRISVKTPAILYIMLMDAGIMMLVYIVLNLWPIAMKMNFGMSKMSPYWFIIVLTSFVTAFFGTKVLEIWQKKYFSAQGRRMPNPMLWSRYVTICIIAASSILLLGLSKFFGNLSAILFVSMLALFNFGYGFHMPSCDTLINYYIPAARSKERATVMSFTAMLVHFFIIVFMFPSTGSSGEATILGWIFPSSLLILLSLTIHILMRRYQRKIGELPLKETLSRAGSTPSIGS